MLRSKATAYAVSAMIELARGQSDDRAGGELRSNTIAERHGLPVSYTAKILSQLARASLLKSGRGPQGGFSLRRAPGDISLLEIFEAVGAVSPPDVELPDNLSSSVQPNLERIVDAANEAARNVLAGATLEDLMADPHGEAHTPSKEKEADNPSRLAGAVPA